MEGKRFGRLVVVEDTGERYHKKRIWLCQCDCGETCKVITGQLTRGTSSCGCLRKESCSCIGKSNRREVGGYRTKEHPLYSTWQGIKQRCYNANHDHYDLYGGRGISVCERWYNSFATFVEDMGERPDGCTLDRKDNNGNYCPENCRWATWKEQANNRGGYQLGKEK